jgi:hypothetical protein
MCPACLASLAITIATGTTAGAAVTAAATYVVRKLAESAPTRDAKETS